MDVEGQRDVLLDAIQQQYKDNVSALEANRRLADEQISYNNEARGTYYSGQPTWDRSQLAVQYGDKMNELNANLLKAQNSVWSNIENYMDKISAYNEAAKKNNGGGNTGGSKYSTNLDDYYSSAKGYQFKDEKGNPITANTWAKNTKQDVWSVIAKMANNKDINAQRAWAGYKNANKQLTAEERRAFQILGIDSSGYGSRP